MKRKKVTGKMLLEWAEWLKEKGMGCCHLQVAETDQSVVAICAGFRDYGNNEWHICAMVAFQAKNNACQCDYDIDWEMPWNVETKDVWDTETEICGAGDTLPPNKVFSKIAAELNGRVKETVKMVKEIEKSWEDIS